MRVDGACHCGAIAFTGEINPDEVRVCHCLDCQQMSGTAFRTNVPCPADTFRLVRGEPKTYVKVAESGARRAMAFCSDCGTQLYACDAEAPSVYSLRTGTLTQRANLSPTKQIWLRSATPWARDLLNVPGFETQPPA
ncbi:MAG TPA: GFA family protein [Caulobacteraceae bacterium]|nr:GFA family protein [Caulobacteraceae bacterium]